MTDGERLLVVSCSVKHHREEGSLHDALERTHLPPIAATAGVMFGFPRSATTGRTGFVRAKLGGTSSATMLLMHERDGVDVYGLPVGVLGAHPNEFFSAIGRVVCVCAVLEEKVTTLRHTLERAGQGSFTHQPVSKQIIRARELSRRLPEPGPAEIGAFCDNAEAAFQRRNELVHSSFPAQPDGRLWGHRPVRDKSTTDGSVQTVETTLEELSVFISELARLVRDFNTVHGLASRPSTGET